MTKREMIEDLNGGIQGTRKNIEALRQEIVKTKDPKKALKFLRTVMSEYKKIDELEREIKFVVEDWLFIP